ncbi:tubulin glycylase 3A-like [Neocloeon triangulifer]|uniref:tubulin glycylase 3A-like n=1 Tax=Neocloeon triangulifer TaxID=2078957 RepID=UPI00286F17C8|nr:tubulin glycylase 3A-like [Neocloeon triangulifer]
MARKKKQTLKSTEDCSNIVDFEDPLLIARLLRNCVPDLVWALRSDTVDWRSLARWQLVNRFPRALFTTKVGLSNALQHMHWFTEQGVSDTFFPRSYCVSQADEMGAFVTDFRLTACFSMLRHVFKQKPDQEALQMPKQIWIPPKAVQFAMRRAKEHTRHLRHEDVDDPEITHKVWECEWDQFLTYYYQLVHECAHVAWESPQQREENMASINEILDQFVKLRPFSSHDGFLNLWIVKPGARSCGRGIQIMKRPMLIYETKFDIRQWFLITCAQPLTIWMYRESYMRFCSQIFDLQNLHESVHLSNNAVQCRYQNCPRDKALPDENMWDCYTFQTYLRSIGRADAWDEIIYPGMRSGIIGTMLASQDWLQDCQKNCFELYGADFLLTENDLQPWLLEINCSPCMAPSTSVTARMCAQCLEDVLKVVVDRRDDKEASTGMFELIYKQNSPPAPPYQGVALGVKGRRMMASRPKRRRRRQKKKNDNSFSSTSSSGASISESSEDENKLNLVGQHRVMMDSPLKVVKADLNAPKKKPVGPLFNFEILNDPGQLNQPPAISASELRSRLEHLLIEKSKHVSRPSSSVQMQTNGSSRPQSASTPRPLKNTKGSKSAAKFKGRVSGKIMAVVKRDDSKLSNKTSKCKVEPQKGKRKLKVLEKSSAETSTDKEQHDSTGQSDEKSNNLDLQASEESNSQSLMLQPDNLRSTKVKLSCIASENSECFRDPIKSLALVKEWRKRLETTRASCEQMLAQLKAFRDPPAVRSSLSTIYSLSQAG